MAFLRRGLVTNKGAVPSVHTRVTADTPFNAGGSQQSTKREAQPSIIIKGVARVLEMATTSGGHHVVELTCGHQAKSKSTFQGYCTRCTH